MSKYINDLIPYFQFKCCGVDSYKDFDVSKQWNRTKSGTFTINPPLITPIACCKYLPDTAKPSLQCAQEPFKEQLNNGNTVSNAYSPLSQHDHAMTTPVLPTFYM